MMNGFEDREKGFEAKYRVDQEHEFKVNARRNKLLGVWAAELMGLDGEASETYAKDVVVADFEKPGDDDVVEKVLKDLADKGVAMDEAAIRKKMGELQAVAREQFAE
jgi:hypothetical protein